MNEGAPESNEASQLAVRISPFWKRLLIGPRPRFTLIRLAVMIGLTAILFGLVFIPIRVTGNSMAPTYQTGRVNLVNRLAYRWHDPQRGDVVLIRLIGFRTPLLKRIVALPGEAIAVHRGTVFINQKPLEEPYLPAKVPWAEGKNQLKAGEYFVVGDNRAISEYYIVPKSQIVGKIVF